MIAMYTSLDGLAQSLGKKIRAVRETREQEPSAYFGRSIYVRSPYSTWQAYVFLDQMGIIQGVQDDHGRWLAKTEELENTENQGRIREAVVYVDRLIATYQENLTRGLWTRDSVEREIEFQAALAQQRGYVERAAAWFAALEAFNGNPA